ncbi:MAG: pirin family protein [Motiliproteus sp.]|nr:pirin family protein [Motiliproteus sp.]
MLEVRKSSERGYADHGWLQTYHSFSFADYYDPQHMGVSSLRVINEDLIQPGGGFPLHPHQNMEIITYLIDGEIEHQDTLGNRNRLKAGMVQVMTAGSGILHSEYNPSKNHPLKLLQIWIRPHTQGLKPGYRQRSFDHLDGLNLLVSPDGRQGSLPINQDALLYLLKSDQSQLHWPLSSGRQLYLQVIEGELEVNGTRISNGDGLRIRELRDLVVNNPSGQPVELLLFDLADDNSK